MLGALAALVWDGVAAGMSRRRGAVADARGQARRGRRARARRGGADRDDARRHPGVRRPDLRRRRRVGRRDRPSGRARSATRASSSSSHERNRGVGAAIVTGYKRALADGDRRRLRDGGRQPDGSGRSRRRSSRPSRAASSTTRRRTGSFTGQAWELMPRTRYLGNAVLSMLTKIASGYWHVADSQSGYTAISQGHARAARPRPRLHGLRLSERPARPPERRGTRASATSRRGRCTASASARASGTTRSRRGSRGCSIKAFFWRLREKYVIRDFHPLVFFYAFGFLATLAGLVLGIVEIAYRIAGQRGERRARSCSSRCCSSPARSSRCLRCGSTWSRTRICAEKNLHVACSCCRGKLALSESKLAAGARRR